MIVSKTPLRASFFGGGTDFKDYYENTSKGYGAVISTTLNMYVYIMVCKRFDDQIRICYREQEMVKTVDEIKHNIIREALRIVGIDKGVDIVYSADIPISSAGIGLASSSALAVGVLNALYAYKGEYVSPQVLAEQACKIEIDILRNPIGKQDQYACAFGGLRKYQFWADGNVTATPVVVKNDGVRKLQDHLMLFYTDITRVSSDILQEQKINISDKMATLDEMSDMVDQAIVSLSEGRISDWGIRLDEAWTKKKKLASKISNGVIDDMYQAARQAGALGGKVLGAGGGGFLLLYAEDDKKEAVRKALSDYREIDFSFENEGSRIVFVEDNRG